MHDEVPASEPARPEDDEQPAVPPAQSTSTDDEPVEDATPPDTGSGPEPGTWVGV